MAKGKTRFEKASQHFFTESLSLEELDLILAKGEVVPYSEDYEDWDPEYLKQHIINISNSFTV